jgi:hypothetical protein
MEFQYSCVNCPDGKELDGILERNEEITLQEFRMQIGEHSYRELEKQLGYTKEFQMKEDRYVTYHQSSLEDGRLVVYMCHSAIEYVYYR